MSSGFAMNHKGKFKFTNKLYKHLTGEEKGLTVSGTVIEPALIKLGIEEFPSPENYQLYKPQQWIQFYQNFISSCKVPARIEMSNGNVYAGNKYSEDGMKAFQKALKEGYRYDVLRIAISLYYSSSIRWKKAIGSYMTSGEWRTDYEELVTKASEGAEVLKKHINRTINESTGAGSHFDMG